MVRTADDRKSLGGKSVRKQGSAIPKRTSASGSSYRGGSGLNPICPRETPSWQKPITNFFTAASESVSESNIDHGSSSSNTDSVVNEIPILNTIDINSKYQQEVMEQDVADDKSAENKENNALNENVTDAEMKESNVAEMENAYDNDELVVPRKKIVLNKQIYTQLKHVEQRISRF